jgi:hypothetical protein
MKKNIKIVFQFFKSIPILKRNKKMEAKRKIIESETKWKNAVLFSLWLEAKNLKRKKAKTNFLVRECAKQIWLRFVSLWGEKTFFAKPAHPSWWSSVHSPTQGLMLFTPPTQGLMLFTPPTHVRCWHKLRATWRRDQITKQVITCNEHPRCVSLNYVLQKTNAYFGRIWKLMGKSLNFVGKYILRK